MYTFKIFAILLFIFEQYQLPKNMTRQVVYFYKYKYFDKVLFVNLTITKLEIE